jgi:hypothetical protein
MNAFQIKSDLRASLWFLRKAEADQNIQGHAKWLVGQAREELDKVFAGLFGEAVKELAESQSSN